MNKLILGSHQSISYKDGLLGTTNQAIADGANTFMIYLTSPQSTIRRAIDKFNIEEAKIKMAEADINIDNIIIHAPYIINLATSDPSKQQFAISFLKQEIARATTLGFKTLVVHPGSHLKLGEEVGINFIVSALNAVLENDDSPLKIALETMAMKGSEIGSIAQIAKIIASLKKKERVGICLDTCHLHDCGIDLTDFDSILDQVETLIGLDKLLVIHLNDSKNERGAKKDRHENIGYGQIGFDTLINIVYNPRLKNVPIILETPYNNEVAPYKKEIASIINKTFDPTIKN